MADEFTAKWIASKHAPPAAAEGAEAPAALEGAALFSALEEDYWDAVDRGAEPVEVEYGNDVDVHEFWSGFPKPGIGREDLSAAKLAGVDYNSDEYFKRSGWNLNNIASWPGSVLRHFTVSVPGVTSPWLYLGAPPPSLEREAFLVSEKKEAPRRHALQHVLVAQRGQLPEFDQLPPRGRGEAVVRRARGEGVGV